MSGNSYIISSVADIIFATSLESNFSLIVSCRDFFPNIPRISKKMLYVRTFAAL